MKSFLKKISIVLVIIASTTGVSHAGVYEQNGYLNSVQVVSAGAQCLLELRYGISPTSDIQKGVWGCDNIVGKSILDLAKTAVILNRKVMVIFEAGHVPAKRVLAITLK
ncbi:hypothetical protein [Bartonella taylorii]|uniref:hypothetical protein n=1 Tax=Bartonella taylorii TaxID=33046 RepID=UPI001ABAA4D6|nr:hypothetical protein [Bartonella taylorii]